MMKQLRFWSMVTISAMTLGFLFCSESHAAIPTGNGDAVAPVNESGERTCGVDNKNDVNEDVTRGLIAYYNFDDCSANNSAGMQNNGVINGKHRFIDDTPNGTGKALYLDQEAFVNVARNPLNGKESYTISMWVKDFGAGYLFTTLGDENLNSNKSASVFVNTDGKLVYSGTWYLDSFNYGIRQIQSSGWHMITIVYQEELIDLFVDGSLTDSQQRRYKNGGHKMQIGGRGEGYSQSSWADPFKVDNVRIYGVALTEAEVGQLYNYERK